MELGLEVPATLYSNDPQEIRDFLRAHGGQGVFKTFRPMTWRDGETAWQPYTSYLTEERLVSDDLLSAVPGIYRRRRARCRRPSDRGARKVGDSEGGGGRG